MTRAGESDVARATVPDMPSTPRRLAGRLLKVVAAIAVVLGVASLPSSAAEDPDRPGLPYYLPGTGGWLTPAGSGLTEVSTAKQWFRLPPLVNAGLSWTLVRESDPRCRRLGDFNEINRWKGTLFFISPPGAPEPYGYVGPFTVRTVAFGSIPVEATVRLKQPRDADNLPIGYDITQTTRTYCAGRGPNASPTQEERETLPAEFEAPVEVRVMALVVDGVPLELTGSCKPERESVLTLSGVGFSELDPSFPENSPTPENVMTTPWFTVANGGLLTGSVGVAPFEGCTTRSGEDISKLLTATVSGSSNGVQVRSQGLKGDENCLKSTSCWSLVPRLPGLPYPKEAAQ